MDEKKREQYRQRLEEMRGRLVGTVERFETDIREAVMAPGDVTHSPTHLGDLDSEGVDNYVTLAQNEEGLLDQAAGALRRIAEGTYGRCQRCGQEVAAVRLDALPHTPYCAACAHQVEAE